MWNLLKDFLFDPLFQLGPTPITPLRLIGIVTISIVVLWVSKFVESAVRRLARRRPDQFSESASYALARIIRYFLVLIGLVAGLAAVGIDITSLSIVGGAIGIGLGFGMQALIANFVAGIVLLLDRSLKVGDFVDLQSGVRGEVVEIALRFTRVHTNDSVDVLVPNSEFISGRVTNWTYDDLGRRLHVSFTAAYSVDKSLVRAAGLAAAQTVAGVILDQAGREPDVWLVKMGDNALEYELVVWVNHSLAAHPGGANARLLWALHDELRARDIEIPFPQRDVWLRSGPVALGVDSGPNADASTGGEEKSQPLPDSATARVQP
jgi:small-conductance mechanosensitive channel